MEPVDKGFKADGFDGLDLHQTPLDKLNIENCRMQNAKYKICFGILLLCIFQFSFCTLPSYAENHGL
jgi:hypothetical protein